MTQMPPEQEDRVGEPGVSPGEPVAGGVGPSQGPTVIEATIAWSRTSWI